MSVTLHRQIVLIGIASFAVGCERNRQPPDPKDPVVEPESARAREEEPPELLPVATSGMDPMVRDQIDAARQSVVAAPDNPRLNGELGMIHHVYRQLEAARVCYLRALAANPKSFRWRYLLGHVQAAVGESNPSIRTLRRATELRPDYLPAYLKLGELHIERGELDEAERNFQHVLDAAPTFARAHAGLGRVAAKRRHFSSAAEHYERSLAEHSGSRAHYALAMAYRRIGRVEDAKEQLRRSESARYELPTSDPLMESVWRLEVGGSFEFRQGLDRLGEGALEEATAHFENALRMKPELAADAHYCLGNIRNRRAEPDLAMYHYRKALEIRPGFHGALNNLGVAHIKKRQYEQAMECFDRVIELRPREPQAHVNLGFVLGHLGRMDEAIEEYRVAVACDMSFGFGQRRLAAALSERGERAEAIPHWREFLRGHPDDISALRSLADDLRAVGRSEEAEVVMERAGGLEPGQRVEPSLEQGVSRSGAAGTK